MWLPEVGAVFVAVWFEADHIPLPDRRHVSELGREEVQELAETPELMESVRSH